MLVHLDFYMSSRDRTQVLMLMVNMEKFTPAIAPDCSNCAPTLGGGCIYY